MSDAGEVVCAFCGEPVMRALDNGYQLVSGWARRRDGGGLNVLRLRTEQGQWAHAYCVDRVAAGRFGQGDLFG